RRGSVEVRLGLCPSLDADEGAETLRDRVVVHEVDAPVEPRQTGLVRGVAECRVRHHRVDRWNAGLDAPEALREVDTEVGRVALRNGGRVSEVVAPREGLQDGGG